MHKTPAGCCGAGCCWMMVAGIVLWWLIASGMLVLTWNRVVTAFASVKPAKLWHALLVVATLAVLSLPCLMSKRGMGRHHCGMDEKAGCPWHKGGDGRSGESAPPGDAGQ